MVAEIGRHLTTMRLATRSSMQHAPPFTFALALYQVGRGSPGRRTHFCTTLYINISLVIRYIKYTGAGENDFTADG